MLFQDLPLLVNKATSHLCFPHWSPLVILMLNPPHALPVLCPETPTHPSRPNSQSSSLQPSLTGQAEIIDPLIVCKQLIDFISSTGIRILLLVDYLSLQLVCKISDK